MSEIQIKKAAEEDFPIGNGFCKTDYIMGLDVDDAKNH
jgi:hypothetical protein